MKQRKKKNKKRVINILIISIILSIMIWIAIDESKDNKVKSEEQEDIKSSYTTQDIEALYKKENTKEKEKTQIKEYPKEEIQKEYKGYEVLAKLEIPSIELETYILKQYSKNTLNISVTKFWGADPNQIGNFCIAGHNFQNKNMFHNLRHLKIGDKLSISDYEVGRVGYEIYDIYTVEPENVKCLSQETEGRREATLITCTTDSKKRIIVKAWEEGSKKGE